MSPRTVRKFLGNGHLGGRGTIAAGGDRGVREAHPLFQHLWRQPVSCAAAHAVLKVVKAGRRLVLISATGPEDRS
jgi:hypothetical protein